MTHGSTYYESRGSCIYCGETKNLSDEHIVPFSLGGVHVLRKASCARCADITKKFEQKVSRDLWGDARAAFNAPTRRRKERKTHIEIEDRKNSSKTLKFPVGEYPAGFVFYKMTKAGFLLDLPDDVDLTVHWQMSVIDDSGRREKFLEKHPDNLLLKFRHVPYDFGRMLAKIGYGQILTSLDPGDFRPICLPYILGTETNVSFVVGGSMDDQAPMDVGYSLGMAGFGSLQRLILVATIRLYANTASPVYHVVVGDVEGEENVRRVMQKLELKEGADNVVLGDHGDEHWSPVKPC